MCLGCLAYYPKTNLASCNSHPTIDNILKGLGLDEVVQFFDVTLRPHTQHSPSTNERRRHADVGDTDAVDSLTPIRNTANTSTTTTTTTTTTTSRPRMTERTTSPRSNCLLGACSNFPRTHRI
ncbi:hypothetical protein Pcinc_044308 [Petrolisthes cinctipes]|uniref:Uncharacterized protein n=1 Tax=Petrolisthes cinctipes TaxID=88211 RepID=A0AAE1EEE8_PETCI|nr:hypothetical protein Pcinc_044308 [Petrolisthes cinctipes]